MLPKSYIWTKKGELRQMDASNRIKGIEDLICKKLGIDDKEFFLVTVRKVLTKKLRPFANIRIFETEVGDEVE